MAHDPENTPIAEDPELDSLEGRIAAARKAEDERRGVDRELIGQVHGSAMTVASTMVGYPLGGIIVGWLLDNVFDTLPWLTITLMFLAFIGACIHVVRMNRDSGGSAE